MDQLKIKIVPTNTLKVGDRYFSYGGIFRVRDVIVSEIHDDIGYGKCHANISDYEGVAPGHTDCFIPVYWRDGWNNQGNSLATTALIIE